MVRHKSTRMVRCTSGSRATRTPPPSSPVTSPLSGMSLRPPSEPSRRPCALPPPCYRSPVRTWSAGGVRGESTASNGRVFGYRMGRRTFLALTAAIGLGVLGASRAIGQSPPPFVPFPERPRSIPSPTSPMRLAWTWSASSASWPTRSATSHMSASSEARPGRSPRRRQRGRPGIVARGPAAGGRRPGRFAWGALDEATAATLLASAAATADEVRQHAVDALIGPQPIASSGSSPDPAMLAQLEQAGRPRMTSGRGWASSSTARSPVSRTR